ncbi:alpha/beta fold hydrolase [Hymenobacter artigasi]|uniref:Pimeloyl-ACP methyl ester carboxylesterase n=1 Tax=Hymenobacter artigasi TaxID=2719616 RepID=A0ABX1HHS2_9BACT|nr:alpha/beta hydrolase [Hymenobacter artigasi]NKI88612.1 pimeloyl-ACP methyl ester carboxylesterase [Hymenobacter artigasi]
MKTAAFACRLSLSLLLLSAAGAAFATNPAAAPAAKVVADNPALHPTFTVRVVGKGQPMLLIPGLNCPGAVWDETVAHYQRQYQCHIISLAGFGGTAPVAVTDPLLPAVRDQLLAYIKTQKLTRPVVVGHSLGGFLALALSVAQPEAIGPLVIVDSLPFLAAVQNPAATVETVKPQVTALRTEMSRGHLPRAAQREMAAGMVTDTARITQVVRWGVASDPATAAQAMYDLYTTDLRPDLGRIRQPVLVLGAWAAYVPYGATKQSIRAVFAQQYARLPQARIEMSEAGRHFLMYDDPQWLLAQADTFLKQPALSKK